MLGFAGNRSTRDTGGTPTRDADNGRQTGVLGVLTRPVRRARQRVLEAVGGSRQLYVIVVLAATLGLDGADTGTVSAAASNLQQAFHIGHTSIGLLVSMVYVAGAVATVPIGMLTDRVRRTRLLAISVVVWSVAMLGAGAAQSFGELLAARVVLGVVTATTGPTLASLTGDYFPAAARARIYGLILGGELVGTGIGYLVSGELAALVSWRFTFWWLVLPGIAVCWGLWRLTEPARGGQSRLRGEQQDRPEDGEQTETDGVTEQVRRRHVSPRAVAVLTSDPREWSTWQAVRYVFAVRTNVVLIVASALGYFYFAGMQSFALVYVTGHYGLSQSVASTLVLVLGVGAVLGMLFGGRLADRLLDRGYLNARVVLPAVAMLGVVTALAPALVLTSIGAALPLLTVGAAMLAAANPPLDAARLDIIHPALWGRAEGVRTVFRTGAQALAPTLFGVLSESVFPGGARGLEYTFLTCLVVLVAGSALVFLARRHYPKDVAALAESNTEQ